MKEKGKVVEWKLKKVAEIEQTISKYPVISIINLEELPNKQLQLLRKKLRDDIHVIITKKVLIQKALEHKKLTELTQFLVGCPALLLSKKDSFTLFKMLKDNRMTAAAKPGQKAPNDIVVQAGPTPFTPGPVISELAQLGLKSKVEAGKIAIREDKVVAKEGQVISGPLASMLARLGIEPMKIGINLLAAYEGNQIYKKDVLDIDVDAYTNDLKIAASDCFKLAVELGITNAETAEFLVSKAHREAKHLAESQHILSEETLNENVNSQKGE